MYARPVRSDSFVPARRPGRDSRAAWTSPRISPAFLALWLVACDGPRSPVLPPPDAGRPPNPSCVALPPPPGSGRVQLERVYANSISGSAAQKLTHVVLPDGARPGFATRQSGRVLRFTAADAAPATVALDLAGRIDLTYGENGLVSMTLDPEFATNGFAYFVYTAPPAGTGLYVARVSRFTYDGSVFDPTSELVILEVPQVDVTHSVDHVAFGSDGMLYVSLGDQRRTDVHAQNPATLPGKLLRIDVSASQPSERYRIPPDNPFVGTGAGEVFAIGLRNPWRFTVDPLDGSMLVGDVGQDRREEISAVVSGGNFGWPAREGTLCFRSDPCDDPSYVDPVVELSHAEMRSVVAGYRYRRTDVPGLEGRVVFADFTSGSIWSADVTDPARLSTLEVDGRFMITSIALDPEGRPTFVRYDPSGAEGGLYRLVPKDPEASSFPTLLSATGCVDATDPREPANVMARFTPTAELWSDGAEKLRAFAIPDGTAIAVDDQGDMVLPVGSVLLKHFGFEGRLHETRLLMRTADGWTGYSYRWNEAQTDAELLTTAVTETLPNGVRWSYPSRSACFQCHSTAAGVTLGLEAAQLGDDSLQALLDLGYFDRRLTTVAALRGSERPPLVAPFGATRSVGERARSYLHANCSNCHRPGGPGRGDIDLRAETAFGSTRLCNAQPNEGRVWDVGVWDEQRLIVPGEPTHSILFLRMNTLGFFRMPPLGTDVVHTQATSLMAEWIESIGTCP